MTSDRVEREDNMSDLSKWDLVEKVIDLEDGIKTFMELDDARLKEIERLKKAVKLNGDHASELTNALIQQELDPSRLESALRMYIAELDHTIHKYIQCGVEDGLDHYPEEVDFFLRCWETAG